MDLDKWQQREAERLAAEEGVSVEEASARLFPAAEEVPVPAAEGAPAEVPAGKVDTTKAKA